MRGAIILSCAEHHKRFFFKYLNLILVLVAMGLKQLGNKSMVSLIYVACIYVDYVYSCVHTCNMFANMTRDHVRERATLSVDGFLYSVRNGLHRTRSRNKFSRNK
jgi:hypothetical protein